MKFKLKKRYLFYLVIILVIAFLLWIFMRPATADQCSMKLNACLLKGKVQSFFPRMWAGIVCTFNNLICLIRQLF